MKLFPRRIEWGRLVQPAVYSEPLTNAFLRSKFLRKKKKTDRVTNVRLSENFFFKEQRTKLL